MPDITVDQFLSEYRKRIVAQGYAWVATPGRLDNFMKTVEAAIIDPDAVAAWSPVGNPVAVETWEALGGKGRVTLAALRKLPPF